MAITIVIPDNPCKCGETVCDATHKVQAVLGYGVDIGSPVIEDGTPLLRALSNATVALLAGAPPGVHEWWVENLNAEIAERKSEHSKSLS